LACLEKIHEELDSSLTFFKRGPVGPSQQCKRASNSIQDLPPPWILTIFKLKFGGGNLFSLAMTSTIEGNNSVGSLFAIVEEGDPCSGLKNVMSIAVWILQSKFIC
jgi:hypothetical protein